MARNLDELASSTVGTETQSPPADEARGVGIAGVRLRVLALVLITQAIVIWWVADSEIARGIYLICYSVMIPTALYLLAVRLFRRWLPFTDREIMLGYVVLTATIPIIGFGGLRFVTEGMGYIPYFARTQPDWTKYISDTMRLPVLHDQSAVQGLYKGGMAVPWQAWAVPIAFWSAYLLLLSAIWICLAGLLRRSWIGQERLTFPVAMLPLQVMDTRDDILRRPIFWIGLAIPAILQSLLAIHEWVPWVPAVQLKAFNLAPIAFTSRPWNAMADFQIGFYPMAIGLAYFIPGSISFSCWFFAVALKLSYVAGAVLGVDDLGVGTARWPFRDEQAAGAWIAFGALLLWNAVRQWRKSSANASAEDQRILRLMGLAAGACTVLCAGMMYFTGIPPAAGIGVAATYVLYIVSASRTRAEAGGLWTFGPLRTPHDVMRSFTGIQDMGTTGLVSSGHFHLVHVDVRAQSLPFLMEGMAIAEKTGIKWRTVLIWVGIGTVSALAMGWVSTLSKLYDIGAATAKANPYPMNKANISFNEISRLAHGGVIANQYTIPAMSVSALFTLVLAWANKLGRTGLHPVGYVLANTQTLNSFILPFFLAWLAKTLVLRFGGSRLYRASIPFFVGLVLGDICTQALWAIVGRVFDVPIYQFLT